MTQKQLCIPPQTYNSSSLDVNLHFIFGWCSDFVVYNLECVIAAKLCKFQLL